LKSGRETLKSVWFWVFRTTFWQHLGDFQACGGMFFVKFFKQRVFGQSRWAAVRICALKEYILWNTED
jgi:hypothetical protein